MKVVVADAAATIRFVLKETLMTFVDVLYYLMLTRVREILFYLFEFVMRDVKSVQSAATVGYSFLFVIGYVSCRFRCEMELTTIWATLYSIIEILFVNM